MSSKGIDDWKDVILTERYIERNLGLKFYSASLPNCSRSWNIDRYTILVKLNIPDIEGNRFDVRFLDSKEGRFLTINTNYQLIEIYCVLQIDLPKTLLYEKTFIRERKRL